MKASKKAAPVTPAKSYEKVLRGAPIQTADDATILHALAAGERDLAVISVSSFKGQTGLDIRRFYLDHDEKSDGMTWRPTSKGIRLNGASGVEALDYLVANRDAIVKLLKS